MSAWLVDSGILVRYVQPRDPLCAVVRSAIRTLRGQRSTLSFVAQSMAEFWNVSTRPTSARGGYGMAPARTESRARILEGVFNRLPEADAAYGIWRRLIAAHSVSGVQVHDARLASAMLAHGVPNILTFNPGDFARYPGINAVRPQDI